MFCRNLLFVFSFFIANCLCAQTLERKNFNHFTTAQGLSQNTVTGITQDSLGYIWIATSSGLNRFNGSNFLQFHSSSDSLSIASEDLKGITWLDKNRIAIYTSGLHIINTRTGASRNLFIPYRRKQFEYKFNMIERAMGEANGGIYVLSRSGFYHFDKRDSLVSRFDFYSEKHVPVAHFFFGRELIDLDNRRLLIITVDGLYLYDKEKKKLSKMARGDYPPIDEFEDYKSRGYLFLPHKKGSFFVLKSLSDTLIYINTAENKKVISQLPFNPIINEIHYNSRLLPVNDTAFYITGHNTGFYKMRFYPETGKVKWYPEKNFNGYQCNALLNDKNNNLWVGTNKGLFYHNENLSRIQIAEIPQSIDTTFPNLVINELFVSANKLYAGTRNFGNVLVYDKSSLQFITNESFDAYRKQSGKSVNVYSVIEASPSTLLFGTNGPLVLMDKITNKTQFLVPPLWNEKLDWAGELFKDSRGTIWISSGKIHMYRHEKKEFSHIPDEALEQTQIRQPENIREDASGNIWMSGHGLSRYNISLQRFDLRIDSFPFIKMPDKQVSAMEIDKKRNIIWFNSNNNGLISYNITNGSFRHFTTANNLPGNNIGAIIIVDDKLWLTAGSGLACMDLVSLDITGFGREDGFPGMPVLNRASFFYDSSSKLLYLGFSKAVARFNPSLLLQKKRPPGIFIEELTINDTNTIFLPGQHITTSWKENEIRVTIGTINFSDASTQRFAYRIFEDESTPWIETGVQPSFSISSLSSGTHKIQVKCFSINNRWPSQVKEFQLTVLPPLWQEGWFVFIVIIIILASIYLLIRWRTNVVRRKEMIKTQIETLKANDYKNQFELEQISNYFSSSLANKKTESDVLWDVSKNLIGRMNYEECIIYLWNKDKTKMVQKAAYGPKGRPELIETDVFEVAPGQGIVGHVIETKQPIIVNDTRKDKRYRVDDQFRLSEVSVPIIHNNELLGIIDSEHQQVAYFSERDIKILTTIATLIGNKLKQIESEQSLEAKKKELAGINEQLAEARLSALQAQMNPHFVFNALNSIKRMILDADNEKASRYLSKFASMIRMTLEHSKEIFVTLDNNIEYLKAYLQMEQLRFDESFTYSICVDENLDTGEIVIPSMMMQPLVENAIWHGLMQADGDKKIKISFCQCDNKVVCTVEDNGIGVHRAEELKKTQRPVHRSVGLENLRKRIHIMNEKYDLGCSLVVKDLSDNDKSCTGTSVALCFNSITI